MQLDTMASGGANEALELNDLDESWLNLIWHEAQDLPHASEDPASPEQALCWGAQLKMLLPDDVKVDPCDDAFVPGKNHLKNRFCLSCKLGLVVPISHVRALTPALAPEFVNGRGSGFWSHGLVNGTACDYRVVNQTRCCRGPALVIFAKPPPAAPGITWGDIPTDWLSSAQPDLMHLACALGTLEPRGSITRPIGAQHHVLRSSDGTINGGGSNSGSFNRGSFNRGSTGSGNNGDGGIVAEQNASRMTPAIYPSIAMPLDMQRGMMVQPAVQPGPTVPPVSHRAAPTVPSHYWSSRFSPFTVLSRVLPSGPGTRPAVHPSIATPPDVHHGVMVQPAAQPGPTGPPVSHDRASSAKRPRADWSSRLSPYFSPPPPTPPLSPPVSSTIEDGAFDSPPLAPGKPMGRDHTPLDLLSNPAVLFGILSPVLSSASIALSRMEHRADVAVIAIEYLACAVPTAAIIRALGARTAARLYCVCLCVAPVIQCIVHARAPTEHLTDTTFAAMQRNLGGFVLVSAGGGILLGCQPSSYVTTRDKWLTAAVYLSAKLALFTVLAARIGHDREVAEAFVMDSAAFVAAIYVSLGLRLDKRSWKKL